MEKGFWIEKNWGESVDNAGSLETAAAFEQLNNADGPEAVFWIGCHDLQYVLKIPKNRELVLIYGENQDLEIKKTMADWTECISLAELFITGDFLLLLQRMYSPEHASEASGFKES